MAGDPTLAPDSATAGTTTQSSASPRKTAVTLSTVAVAHWLYFGFAIVALLLLCLLVPQQTSRAPLILAGAFVFWCGGVAVRAGMQRADRATLQIGPGHLFVPVVLAAYTVFAFDASPAVASFTPSSPDSMPGLHADQHAYFAIVLCAVSAFCGWYGIVKGRLVETMLAAQIVFLSVMYERSLSGPAVVPPLVLMAAALALLRYAPLGGNARPLPRSTLWIAVPLGLFVLAAFVATAFGELRGASLNTSGKMLALAVLAIVLFDALHKDRPRWLIWSAIVAPAVAVAAFVIYKLVDIAIAMGVSYAIGNRLELASGVEVNPLGLSFTLGILLIAGAMPRFRDPVARWAGVAMLALLVPALIVTYSVGSLLGLACGLLVLATLALTRQHDAVVAARRRLAPVALLAAIALIVIAAYAVPDHTRNGLRYTLEDPSTGRSRVDLWEASLRDTRANPLLGVGPSNYVPRARYVPDFPTRDISQVLERRRLLGHDTTQWRFLFVGHPHNLLLDVAEGMGVAGLGALAAGAVAAALTGVRILRTRAAEERWFTRAGLAMLVAVVAWSMGSVGVQIVLLPLPAWIALAIVTSARSQNGEAALSMPRWLSPQLARAFGGLALGLALLVFVVRPIGSLAATAAARDHLATGDDAAAADAFRIAGVFDPLDIGSRMALANIDLRQGDIAGALAHTRAASARAPRTGAIAVRLGELSWLQGDVVAAERYFRQGTEQDAWQLLNADPYTPLGLLLITNGDTAGGEAAIAAGLRVSPSNARDPAWVAAPDGGVALDRAYAPGATVGEDAPLLHALQRRLGLAAGKTVGPVPGDILLTDVIALTESDAREVRETDPGKAAEILHQAGLAYQAAGEHDAASRILMDAVVDDPDASYIRHDLAQSLVALNDDDAAEEQLEEVVRIARASDTYDLRLGFAERDLALIAMRREDYADAVQLMLAALDDYRWAYLPQAHEALAQAYQRLGDPGEAAKWRDREAFLQGRD